MKTTVKHVGSVREWEGPVENSMKHLDVIEHWVDGGEVEYCIGDGKWLDKMNMPADFHIGVQYRINQREPKPGEVWTLRGYAYLIHEFSGDFYQSLTGREYCKSDSQVLEYAAPSVEAYYARKFLNESKVDLGNNENIGGLLRAVHKAAQLDR